MANDAQMSRRSFITRLTTVAGGLVVAGSATELLTGCTGGGGGNFPRLPTAPPALGPAPSAPEVIGAALADFTETTGLAANIVSNSPADAGTINRVVPASASQIFFVNFTAQQNGNAPSVVGTPPRLEANAGPKTAAQLGFDDTDIANFIEALRQVGLLDVAIGDREIRIRIQGISVDLSVLCDALNRVKFNPTLHSCPHDHDDQPLDGTPLDRQDDFSRACRHFNRAVDGHLNYDLVNGLVVDQNGNIAVAEDGFDNASDPNDDSPQGRQRGLFIVVKNLTSQTSNITINGRRCGRITSSALFEYTPFPGKPPIWSRAVQVICDKCPQQQTGTGTGGG